MMSIENCTRSVAEKWKSWTKRWSFDWVVSLASALVLRTAPLCNPYFYHLYVHLCLVCSDTSARSDCRWIEFHELWPRHGSHGDRDVGRRFRRFPSACHHIPRHSFRSQHLIPLPSTLCNGRSKIQVFFWKRHQQKGEARRCLRI